MDETLRSLERKIQEDPGDRWAAHALADAYEKSGDSGQAWKLWCRLARDNDTGAQLRLQRPAKGLRSEPTIIHRCEFSGRTSALGRTAASLVFRRGSDLVTLSSEDLSERWTSPMPPGAAAVVGPFVVHPGRTEPPTLSVREVETGLEVAEISLGEKEAPIAYVQPDTGHVVVSVRPRLPGWHEWVLVVDLVSPTPVVVNRLNTADLGVDAEAACAGSLLCDDQRTDERGVVALVYEDGSERWQSVGGVVASDRSGVVLVSWEDDPDEPSKEIWEVDALTGASRWRRETGVLARPGPLLLTPTSLIHATHRDPWHGAWPGDEVFLVSAFDRRSGEPLWQYREDLGRHAILGSAVAEDVVYVVVAGVERKLESPPGLLETRLVALDVVSGELLFAQRLEVPPRGRFGPRVTLMPLENSLAVLVARDDSARLEILGLPE